MITRLGIKYFEGGSGVNGLLIWNEPNKNKIQMAYSYMKFSKKIKLGK